jgi:hypothetical protein
LVEDLNIWFRRDLLSLIFKWTFQELLIIFPLFAHKWRSKYYILTQLKNNALMSIIEHDAIWILWWSHGNFFYVIIVFTKTMSIYAIAQMTFIFHH